ncbi:hypothetical protein [Stakelama pacifica]|uniref:Uncharacterized protein n=1 Tax=Stakelama pacifica TaxID=517720 RepID=A0A4R6FLP4_9SPHN|nr:hypothetical protein [Stakelama pacifica]MAX00932.1 hypothetical protein [Sphingomonas sp.]TDN82317.1 hypothetical protein EV664_106125 [Stakelama pacifica]GGO95653.1 hypothetical protein GCM10011329_20310 [Stakelama pacifica]
MPDEMLAPRRNDTLTPETLPRAERPSPVLQRLHALVAKGYRPTLGVGDNIDSIVLRHRARTPDLVLHADGVVEGLGGRLPFYKRDLSLGDPIGAGGDDQQLRFLQLLNAVPRASLRDRTRRFRHRYVYLPLAMGAIWMACIGLTMLVLSNT